jgi:hypothetical protein
MTQSFIFPLLAIVILYVASYSRDSYQLDWSHTGVQSAPVEKLASNTPPPPVLRSRLPVLTPAPAPPSAVVSPRVPVRTHELTVAVRHFFNHEKDRYVAVDNIQTTVYRNGQYHTETLWNVAGNSEVNFVVENLSQGDRYQIEIFWDDGSRRWFDETVGRVPLRRLYVDEPGAFEQAR